MSLLGGLARCRRCGPTVCFTLFMLSACTTLGPDYAEPEVAWLSDWQSDLYGQVGDSQQQTAVDLRFWWQLFDDPVLTGLIETARQQNPSLRIAGLRILESRAALGIAGSNLYPQVQQLSSAVTYVNTRQYGGKLNDDQDLTSYQAGLGLGWELDFWGRFRRGVEAADAGFFASIADHQDVQVLLSAQVADLYYAYRTLLLRIVIAQRNTALQKRSFEITERLFRSGQSAELDLQQARTQYLATLSTIPSLEITLTQVRNALGALLGRAPGDLAELEPTPQPLPLLDPPLIQEIPARLVLRRPDVRRAAWQVAAQSAQIGIAAADYYPAISLVGSIGWSGNSLSASPDTATLAVGPSVTWNLFDHGRIRNNVRLQDARLQQSIEGFQNSVLQAARQIDDAAINVIKSREQQGVLTESTRAAERSLELANKRYQEGYADFQRVLDAQRSLATQSDREMTNQGSHISAVINLYKALGGGWVDTPIQQLIPEATRSTMQARTDWGELLSAPLPPQGDETTPDSGASP